MLSMIVFALPFAVFILGFGVMCAGLMLGAE